LSANANRTGARIRAERKARRMTVEALAEALRDAANERDRRRMPKLRDLCRTIRGHEAGEHPPGPRYKMLYAVVFGTTEEEFFGSDREGSRWGDPDPSTFTPDDEERLNTATRRPRYHDPGVVDALASVLDGQRRTEDVIGSAPLIEAVRGQLAVVSGLVTEARGEQRKNVVHIASQWAQFYGWLQSNTGNLTVGGGWLDRALEWALEADDPNLVSEVLSFKGHIAWMSEQVGAIIGLSTAALRRDGLYPGQYAMSSALRARGHAMAGDLTLMEVNLDLADNYAAAARENPEEAPPWLYYHCPALFLLQRGLAYRYAGHYKPAYHLRAADALTRGLGELPAEVRESEWAGEFVFQLGHAYLKAADHDRADAVAEDLFALAIRIDSQRLADQATDLRGRTRRSGS
jgi:transcriptional regulator with XRE-family HTH domain